MVPLRSRLQRSPASGGPPSSGTVPTDLSERLQVGLGALWTGCSASPIAAVPLVCFVSPSSRSSSCGTIGDAQVEGCRHWGGHCPPPGSSSCATGFVRLSHVESAAFSGIINDGCRKEELLLSCLLFHQPRSLFSCSAARYPASLSIKSLHLVWSIYKLMVIAQ